MFIKFRTAIIVLLLLALVAVGFGFSYQHATRQPVAVSPYTLEVKKGDTLNSIITNLRAGKLLIQPLWFKVIAYQKNVQNKLKAGEYEIPVGATMPQIIDMLAEGRAKKYAVTFPEGWNLKEILKQLAETPNLNHTLNGKSLADIGAALQIADKNPEGWFFPDTYVYEKNDDDLAILRRAHKQMQTVLAREWQQKQANLPYKSPYEALIMASIVEKETGVKSERPWIASVFVNRLKKGMLLQTDPTVIYGMGDRYDGNIRLADLHKATAYNTYVIGGLPPTPIAMPGQESIHAALHPSQEQHLYFVAKGDGSHYFSLSLDEHNRAVNQFQKKRHVR